ncbi:hypothetical protein DM860_007194 [Cuscuta australis]|uniref:Uncharacterized protein n=1 Tax=Cuscuta australis TaxID=267555 RepID=A0A328E329_9ASTE|nr:hypothetical protein DM860_007194 [Cuscuta australis]
MAYEEHRYGQVERPKYDCLLFDLDDTLYPLSSGLAAACGKNIRDYMVEKLGIEPSKIQELGNLLYKNYGTTMAGLRAIGYEFDYDEYHRFVHGRLPYENLKPDPVLRTLLLSLPYRKVIFTNADKDHAVKVLRILGLEDCFEGIICFETLNPAFKFDNDKEDKECPTFVGREGIFDIIGHFSQPETPVLCKPSVAAIEKAVEIANLEPHRTLFFEKAVGLPKTPVLCKPSVAAIEKAVEIANLEPHRTLFFEDSVRNIQAGKCVGLHTVLVGKSQRVEGADYALGSIHNMKEALPELWETDKAGVRVKYSGVAVPAFVIA